MSDIQGNRVVAPGETSEVVYDGQFFVDKYLEVAQVAQEARRLTGMADNITNQAVERLMDADSGEPLYTRPGQVPEHLTESLASSSLSALIYRVRARYFRTLRKEAKNEFSKIYLEHYGGRKMKITAKKGQNPICKLGVGHVGKLPHEVTGKLAPHDIDLVLQDRPLLPIRGRVDWYSVQVLDHATLEPMIDIEMLD